mgnify:FL=1
MGNLKSGIILQEGERVIVELEAELWAQSNNPIAKFIGEVQRLFARIMGHSRKGFLVITDRRVVEIVNITNCYVFNTDKVVKYVLPSSVKEVGFYKTSTCGVFCPAYLLYYQANTETNSIRLKTSDEREAHNIVDAFYNALKHE